MTMGFGFCPNCGSPRMSAQQAQCGVCGLVFSAAQPPLAAPPAHVGQATPPAPPAWAQQPPAAPPAPQYAPPPADYSAQGYQQPGQPGYPPQGYPQQPGQPGYPPQGYPQGYPPQGYMPGYAPAKGPNAGVIAAIALGAVALLVVIIAAVVLIASSGNSYPGSITFSPSSYSCGSSSTGSVTIKLPSSVQASDEITVLYDGVSSGVPIPVGDLFTKQSDNSWQYASGNNGSNLTCSGRTSVGSHTMTIKDSTGKILAEGHYTINP